MGDFVINVTLSEKNVDVAGVEVRFISVAYENVICRVWFTKNYSTNEILENAGILKSPTTDYLCKSFFCEAIAVGFFLLICELSEKKNYFFRANHENES